MGVDELMKAFMYSKEIKRYEAAEIHEVMGRLATLVPMQHLLGPREFGAYVGYFPIAPDMPHVLSLAVVIWTSGFSTSQLAELASKEFFHCNYPAMNLLKNHCFAILGDEQDGIFFNAEKFPLLAYPETLCLRVLLVGDSDVFDVVHRYTRNSAESFMDGMSAQNAFSGINFNPFRVYSEEELSDAKDSGDGVHVPGYTAVRLRDGDLCQAEDVLENCKRGVFPDRG